MNKELIGKRIREEREKSGLTQGDLASRMGWNSHAIVVEVEAGRRDVKAWELVKLADALCVDLHALLMLSATTTRPYVFWRARPLEDAALLEKKFLQRSDDYGFLESQVIQKTVVRESLPIHPIDPEAADWDWANDLADKVRSSLGLGSFPAANLTKVLEERYGVRFLSLPLGENGSAASSRHSDVSSVLINSDEVPWRQIFSVAHEVFHLVTWDEKLFRQIENSAPLKDRIEKLANAFAAGLLMPEDSLRAELRALTDDSRLSFSSLVVIATKFGVSISALLWRMVSLNLLARTKAEELLQDDELKRIDRMQRRGAKESAVNFGYRFIHLAYMSYQKGRLSKARLSKLLGVSLLDVEPYLFEQGLAEVADYEIAISHS